MNTEPNDERINRWLRETRETIGAELDAGVDLVRMLARVKLEGTKLRHGRAAAATPSGELPLNSAAVKVGRFFRRNPEEEFDDYDICKITGLMPTQTYPALREFVTAGWIAERWQADAQPGEPRRVFYRLTDHGRTELGQVIAEHDARYRTGQSGITRPALNDQ